MSKQNFLPVEPREKIRYLDGQRVYPTAWVMWWLQVSSSWVNRRPEFDSVNGEEIPRYFTAETVANYVRKRYTGQELRTLSAETIVRDYRWVDAKTAGRLSGLPVATWHTAKKHRRIREVFIEPNGGAIRFLIHARNGLLETPTSRFEQCPPKTVPTPAAPELVTPEPAAPEPAAPVAQTGFAGGLLQNSGLDLARLQQIADETRQLIEAVETINRLTGRNQ